MTDFYNGVHNAYHEAKLALYFAQRAAQQRARIHRLAGTQDALKKLNDALAELQRAKMTAHDARSTVSPEAARSIDAKFEERARREHG